MLPNETPVSGSGSKQRELGAGAGLLGAEHLVLVCGAIPQEDGSWKFITTFGAVVLRGNDKHLRLLLPLCDGSYNRQVIVQLAAAKYDSDVSHLLDVLIRQGIVAEVRNIHRSLRNFFQPGSIAEISANQNEIVAAESRESLPPLLDQALTPVTIRESSIGALLALRQSTYEFDESSISFDTLGNLFWSMYGVQSLYRLDLPLNTMSVPSGGGLYGLRLDLFLLREVPPLTTGHYFWRPKEACFQLVSDDERAFIPAMFQPNLSLKNVNGVVFISADLDRIAEKYGSKSYPLALLEAGHVMQNAYLFSAQEGLGIAEIFGVDHFLVETVINGNGKVYQTLVGAIFGIRALTEVPDGSSHGGKV